ncbi:hypothetical protein FA13DRAFT_1905107 [Coprinellus micaceus]|uniref:Uncharacterized protein n=1 Tax=Coprinellus micaceus TaxID=71717 RepID=A0A4Y7SSS9_COPMI|nr:hypothetical protein FA13DRAFT_1905107 [Coprinellus micaceus]
MNRDYTAIANRTLVTSGAGGYHGGTRGTAQNVPLLEGQKFEADALRVWHLCHPYWRTMNQDRTTIVIEIPATRGAGIYYSSTWGAVQNAPLLDKADALQGRAPSGMVGEVGQRKGRYLPSLRSKLQWSMTTASRNQILNQYLPLDAYSPSSKPFLAMPKLLILCLSDRRSRTCVPLKVTGLADGFGFFVPHLNIMKLMGRR